MTSSLCTTLLVPGLDGSLAPHWQDWWARSDPKALMVQQDDWANPTPEAWEAEVAGAVLLHPGAILVAHSLGCLVVARLLAKWPHLEIGGALLVAPPDPERSERLRAFRRLPVGRFDVPSLIVASRNDPWAVFSKAEAYAQTWGSALLDYGAKGHINAESGFGPWAEGRVLRERLGADCLPGRATAP